MRLRTLLLTLGFAVFAVVPGCSCGRQPKPEVPLKPVYTLCLEASPRLNWFDDRANTLFVRVFQLSSADAFAQADPARLLARDAMPPGLVGTPVDRTVFPGAKDAVQLRLEPDTIALGVVAGYFRAQGRTKVVRQLDRTKDDDDEGAERKNCMVFGANGIEGS